MKSDDENIERPTQVTTTECNGERAKKKSTHIPHGDCFENADGLQETEVNGNLKQKYYTQLSIRRNVSCNHDFHFVYSVCKIHCFGAFWRREHWRINTYSIIVYVVVSFGAGVSNCVETIRFIVANKGN